MHSSSRDWGKRGLVVAAGGATALVLSSCGLADVGMVGAAGEPKSVATVSVAPIASKQGVSPANPIVVKVAAGRLTAVDVRNPNGRAVKGLVSSDGRTWVSRTTTLDYGATYAVTAKAVDREGVPTVLTGKVTTVSPQRLASTSISPLADTVMGVGMPIKVSFDQNVSDRAAVEKRLEIITSAAKPIEGAWAWTSEREVTYRPKTYWPGNTAITVNAKMTGVHFGEGVWGEKNRSVTFRTGNAMVSTVNMRSHVMTVTRNGARVRTIPITTGKSGFETRSGVKVIMSKERTRLMDAATGGTSQGSSEYYRLTVAYAMRLTWSGEFLHAAPWSVGSQGSSNVSHGCTGMSTGDAAWLYSQSRPGDVVVYTGNNKGMETDNGITVWNVAWDRWLKKSATGSHPTVPAKVAAVSVASA